MRLHPALSRASSRAGDGVEQDGVHIRFQDDFDYGVFLGQNRITESLFQLVQREFAPH